MRQFVKWTCDASAVGVFASDAMVMFAIAVLLISSSCRTEVEAEPGTLTEEARASPAEAPANFQQPASNFPNLQAEITDDRFKTANSEIGQFDFRNFTYPLPRGWQHPEATEITLGNGKVKPVSTNVNEEMSDEMRAEAKAARRIGMSYVTTRFMDVTGDGNDEAVVILKVETRGNAVPQLVYVYEWKDGAAQPDLEFPHRRPGRRRPQGYSRRKRFGHS